jgi:hypothetical protein
VSQSIDYLIFLLGNLEDCVDRTFYENFYQLLVCCQRDPIIMVCQIKADLGVAQKRW